MPSNAVFWHGLRTYIFQISHPRSATLFAKRGKPWQITAVNRSLSVVRQGVQNYQCHLVKILIRVLHRARYIEILPCSFFDFFRKNA